MTKITAARALTAHIARRVLKLATIIVLAVFVVLIAIIWVLAHFFSGWWWILLLPVIVLLAVFMLIRMFVRYLILRIHIGHLLPEQKRALDDFTEKLERLIEARGTPPQLFVFICLKDLVLHRDVTTIKQIVRDSTSLKHDFDALDRLF